MTKLDKEALASAFDKIARHLAYGSPPWEYCESELDPMNYECIAQQIYAEYFLGSK